MCDHGCSPRESYDELKDKFCHWIVWFSTIMILKHNPWYPGVNDRLNCKFACLTVNEDQSSLFFNHCCIRFNERSDWLPPILLGSKNEETLSISRHNIVPDRNRKCNVAGKSWVLWIMSPRWERSGLENISTNRTSTKDHSVNTSI
jgi:hypothetical protein